MIGIGTGNVWNNGATEVWSLYKTGSAENHKTSDDTTLRTELIKALNAPAAKKQAQGGGVYRMKINDGLGYIVYKEGVAGMKTAAIFHYHWNYNLDLPLTT